MRRQGKVGHGSARRRFRRAGVLAATAVILCGPAASAGAESGFRCALAERGGVPEPDASTIEALLCEELRRVSGGEGGFALRLAGLGETVFVTARADSGESLTVQVDALAELPIVAERMARALVLGESLASTQRVGNLLESESRPVLSKRGSFDFTVGVADVESLGHGARATGFSLGLVYAAPRFALPAELRIAWGDSGDGEPGLGLFSLSVGGRAYLTARNTSPFLGGGLGITRVSARDAFDWYSGRIPDHFDGTRFGAMPYLELGVEALRLHQARVALHIRADLPTGALESPDRSFYYGESGLPVRAGAGSRSRYVVPLSIGLTLAY